MYSMIQFDLYRLQLNSEMSRLLCKYCKQVQLSSEVASYGINHLSEH